MGISLINLKRKMKQIRNHVKTNVHIKNTNHTFILKYQSKSETNTKPRENNYKCRYVYSMGPMY